MHRYLHLLLCFRETVATYTVPMKEGDGPGKSSAARKTARDHTIATPAKEDGPEHKSSAIEERDRIAAEAKALVQQLNDKRAQDPVLVADFKAALDAQVSPAAPPPPHTHTFVWGGGRPPFYREVLDHRSHLRPLKKLFPLYKCENRI